MGDLHRKLKDPGQAEKEYSRAREIREALAGDRTKPGARRDLSSILVKLGNIRKSEHDLDGALKLFREAADIDRILAAELKTDQAKDDYAVSLLKTGDILRKRGDIHDAVECNGKAVEIFTAVCGFISFYWPASVGLNVAIALCLAFYCVGMRYMKEGAAET
jgi:tetratricopeptide (TPR) repeat protein